MNDLIKKLTDEQRDKLINDLGGYTQKQVGHMIGRDTTIQVIKALEDGTFIVKIKQ